MERLYHYTTAAGLKGIVEGRTVWASDYRFLNDSQEFRYGMSVFRKVVFQRGPDLASLYDGKLFEHLKYLLDVIVDPTRDIQGNLWIFIASFSGAPDLLSQWRGYNGGKGYSIGVNREWLEDCVRNSLFSLAHVHYEVKDQERALNERVNQLIELVKTATGDLNQIVQFWLQLAFQTIAYCKHPSFVEEREFRAVRIENGWPNAIRTRPSLTGLIPYLEIPLDGARPANYINHENNLGFEHIIIGPALHDRQKHAVDAMLAPLRMRFEVTKSVIPFVAD